MTTPHPHLHVIHKVGLAEDDAVKEIVAATGMNLWEAVDPLTRLRPSRHGRCRVAIFRSARARPGTFACEEVKRSAAALTEIGCDIVTGGGPWLRQAADDGAANVGRGQHSTGIRVELHFEQEVNPFVEQDFRHKSFFSRLHHVVFASDPFVVAPGGIGTVLALLGWSASAATARMRHSGGVAARCRASTQRCGYAIGPKPSLLLARSRPGRPRDDAERRMANPMDVHIPRCLGRADEAIAVLREEHARWREQQRMSAGADGARRSDD